MELSCPYYAYKESIDISRGAVPMAKRNTGMFIESAIH